MPAALIEAHGAVSAEVAAAMADGRSPAFRRRAGRRRHRHRGAGRRQRATSRSARITSAWRCAGTGAWSSTASRPRPRRQQGRGRAGRPGAGPGRGEAASPVSDESPAPVVRPGERIHVIGIAGSGAAGVALLLHHAGARVDGCDADTPSPYTPPLEAAGIRILIRPRSGPPGGRRPRGDHARAARGPGSAGAGRGAASAACRSSPGRRCWAS